MEENSRQIRRKRIALPPLVPTSDAFQETTSRVGRRPLQPLLNFLLPELSSVNVARVVNIIVAMADCIPNSAIFRARGRNWASPGARHWGGREENGRVANGLCRCWPRPQRRLWLRLVAVQALLSSHPIVSAHDLCIPKNRRSPCGVTINRTKRSNPTTPSC